ncbi:MAG: ABC transporter ATP-binding protein [Miltoncostaeaceae bacterium]
MAGEAIMVRGLRKSYGPSEVVRGIDLSVAPGEVFGLLGTNGAGKTTTVEILEGYRRRSGGEVSVLGRDPEHGDRRWRDRIGLVHQESELDPVHTVGETVRLFAALSAHPSDVAQTIALVGLEGREDVRIGHLSGGQRRRVDVALALINDPELVFLDEPTTGFDPAARREAWGMVRDLAALGKTVLLTTHYMDEAEHLADRVAILHRGSVVAEGPPARLGQVLPARISFVPPAGVSAARVAGAVGHHVDESAGEAVLRVPRGEVQSLLHRLVTWAEREGLALDGLAVGRPSLEDAFLALTADDEEGSGG